MEEDSKMFSTATNGSEVRGPARCVSTDTSCVTTGLYLLGPAGLHSLRMVLCRLVSGLRRRRTRAQNGTDVAGFY